MNKSDILFILAATFGFILGVYFVGDSCPECNDTIIMPIVVCRLNESSEYNLSMFAPSNEAMDYINSTINVSGQLFLPKPTPQQPCYPSNCGREDLNWSNCTHTYAVYCYEVKP